MSLVGGDHQSRASAFVHRVDLGAVAKHQLKSCDVLCKRGGVQRGPAGGGNQTRFLQHRRLSVILRAAVGFPNGTDVKPHRPLASLVLIMETPADSSSLSAATLWPFILHEKSAEQNSSSGSMICYDIAKGEAAAGEEILTEHSAGG